MLVKFLKQINDSPLETLSTNGIARYAGRVGENSFRNVAFVHRIKRNQVVISEALYIKLNTLLTSYINSIK